MNRFNNLKSSCYVKSLYISKMTSELHLSLLLKRQVEDVTPT